MRKEKRFVACDSRREQNAINARGSTMWAWLILTTSPIRLRSPVRRRESVFECSGLYTEKKISHISCCRCPIF